MSSAHAAAATAAVAQGFLEAKPERAKDGQVLSAFLVTSFVIGRLSLKEVPTPGVLILTERALYEFKGLIVTQKETRRISWDEFHGLLLNTDNPSRFLPLVASSAVKTTRAYESSDRQDLLAKMKQAYVHNNQDQALWVCELGEGKIATLLKALPQSAGRSWRELVAAADSGSLMFEPSVTQNTDMRKSIRSTKSVRKTVSSSSKTTFSSLVFPLWDQLVAAMDSPQTAQELAVCSALTARLSVILPFESKGNLASPKDEAQALLAVTLVLADPALCRALISTLLVPRELTQNLLEDLEENLASSLGLVRRWASVAFFASMPTFEQLNQCPASSGWLAASKLHAEQTRLRENALARLLFPGPVREKQSTLELGDGENATLMLSKPAGAPISRKNPPVTSSAASSTAKATRRASNMLSSIIGGTMGAISTPSPMAIEEEPGENSGGRKQRTTLSLVWICRLLDLEDLGPITSSQPLRGGILKSDVQTLLQFLLGKIPDPAYEDSGNVDFEVETFGAGIEFPEFFAPIVASVTATRNEDVRCLGLKQLNVLLMRNNAAMRSVLAVQDWQSIIFAPLYNVPLLPSQRTPAQDDIYSYTLHMVTMLHLSVLGSSSSCSEFGPIDKLFGQTLYKLAVNSGWGEPVVAIARSIFKGLFSTLGKQASMATCSWKYNPTHDEWEEIFRLSHLLQTFLFYRPSNLGLREVSETVAKASREAATNTNLGTFTDWRSRITHHPLLSRVQNERLLAAHRQMYAKMNLPVMTPTHRGDEIGIHLDEAGMCHDRSLVETAIKLWTALGVTGNESQDRKKAEELLSKADKSRILYASNVCRELVEVLRLFDLVDDKRAAVIKAATKTSVRRNPEARLSSSSTVAAMSNQQRDQLSAIAHSKTQDFLYKQKNKEQNVGFLSKAKPKSTTTSLGLRQNLLQKRTDVVRKLGSGSDGLQPQLVSIPLVIAGDVPLKEGESVNNNQALRKRGSRLHIRADENTMRTSQAPLTTTEIVPRNSALDEPSVFEAATRSIPASSADSISAPSRKTLVHLKPNAVRSPPASPSINNSASGNLALLHIVTLDDDVGTGVRRTKAPLCFGCNLGIFTEFDEVQKFGQVWHAECLLCSNCSKLVLDSGTTTSMNGNNSKQKLVGDNQLLQSGCKFFPNAGLLLCSKECENQVLIRDRDTRCAGCLDNVLATDAVVNACGKKFHVETQCFRCSSCDLSFDALHPYFQVQDEVYCGPCVDVKFCRCKCCSEPLLETDKVVEAQNWQYHDRCFACWVCKETFVEDNYFPGEREGELLCYMHHLEQRTPPCTFCHLPFNPKLESEAPVAIAGLNFHRHCMQCSKCSRKLVPLAEPGSDEAAEEHDGQLFCTDCYVEEFGLECHRCKLGIKGDVLHAGIGKRGEGLHWHPECFVCQDCSTQLLEVPFFLVSVGEEDLVSVCERHFHARYSNQTCPGCKGFVSPGRSRVDEDDELLPGLPASNLAAPSLQWNNNPAIMYDDIMWHARCLTCEDPGCGVGLYEDSNSGSASLFKVQTNRDGLRMCAAHFESTKPHCFTCQLVLGEDEEVNEVMGWFFHDTPQCFACSECRGPIEAGQALVRLPNGPTHQKCNLPPSTSKKPSLLKRLSFTLGKRQ
ncbi:hypothetical protein BASA81_002278 [Batrachochytrium salamandrivorans]|nr:hypothetical protein BASA81_002278 [Batrachochytrium salamandrivorans]